MLPRLGAINAQIRLQGDQLTLALRTEKSETVALLRSGSFALRSQLDEAGLKIVALGVDSGNPDDGAAER